MNKRHPLPLNKKHRLPLTAMKTKYRLPLNTKHHLPLTVNSQRVHPEALDLERLLLSPPHPGPSQMVDMLKGERDVQKKVQAEMEGKVKALQGGLQPRYWIVEILSPET